MKYRKLGNTGLIVSEVALGTMQMCIRDSNIAVEVIQKGVGRNEMIRRLGVAVVQVIPFAGFVVESQHAHIIDDIRKRILEIVGRSGDAFRDFPHDYFGKGVL